MFSSQGGHLTNAMQIIATKTTERPDMFSAEVIQEVFHVYLNKFENAVTH